MLDLLKEVRKLGGVDVFCFDLPDSDPVRARHVTARKLVGKLNVLRTSTAIPERHILLL